MLRERGPERTATATISDAPACRQQALDLLARREHSRVELERKLTVRSYTDDVIKATLDQLEATKLIDHARFAESFIRARANKGQGPVRIRRDLRDRGIEADLADLAFEGSDIDWFKLAATVRQRKYTADVSLSYKERARQSRFLQYRGFTLDQIRAALDFDDNSD